MIDIEKRKDDVIKKFLLKKKCVSYISILCLTICLTACETSRESNETKKDYEAVIASSSSVKNTSLVESTDETISIMEQVTTTNGIETTSIMEQVTTNIEIETTSKNNLSTYTIAIDAGHQLHGDFEK